MRNTDTLTDTQKAARSTLSKGVAGQIDNTLTVSKLSGQVADDLTSAKLAIRSLGKNMANVGKANFRMASSLCGKIDKFFANILNKLTYTKSTTFSRLTYPFRMLGKAIIYTIKFALKLPIYILAGAITAIINSIQLALRY